MSKKVQEQSKRKKGDFERISTLENLWRQSIRNVKLDLEY